MEKIGDYLVHRLIGEGGMGKVYEAEERLSKRRVALKVLRPELGRSEVGRRMFLSEMTILAHLDHPNIVRSLASTEVDGELVMVLEYLDGKTLREHLTERGRCSWIEAVAVALQVAAALRAAHGQEPPIIHRDLKPENLMILPDGRVVVMDFGIAKVLEAMRQSTTHSVGTLQYMSPEQIDAAGVDARTDIYCLGLICYEMLAGQPPFESASPRELLNLQCTQAPPPLPDEVRAGLPRGVEQTLLQMLEKAPADRPDDADAVIAALEPFGSADGGALATTAAAPVRTSAGGQGGQTGKTGQGRVGLAATVPAHDSGAQSMHGTDPAGSRRDLPRATAAQSGKVSADTVALIEQASRRREISGKLAVVLVVLLCVLAGAATYAVRALASGNAPRDVPGDVPGDVSDVAAARADATRAATGPGDSAGAERP